MRNTVRFLLGNLAGFDPAADALPVEQMVAIDRWALARAAALHEEIVEAYRKYEYHLIYQKIHNFCVVDLGGFYLDILKDRLYTTPKKSVARRSAQTALYHIAESMVRWLAPILSFTAKRSGASCRAARGESVFLETWHELPAPPPSPDDDRLERVHRAQDRRRARARKAARRRHHRLAARCRSRSVLQGRVPRAIQIARRGTALPADRLQRAGEAREQRRRSARSAPSRSPKSRRKAACGSACRRRRAPKCERCWHHRPEVGSNAEHPTLCGRCVENVAGPGESRTFV